MNDYAEGFDHSAASMPELGSGVLSFASTQAGEILGNSAQIPCRVSVDMSMEFQDEYHWVPRIVKLEGTGIVVDGACGG
jgi:hypothetical protein